MDDEVAAPCDVDTTAAPPDVNTTTNVMVSDNEAVNRNNDDFVISPHAEAVTCNSNQADLSISPLPLVTRNNDAADLPISPLASVTRNIPPLAPDEDVQPSMGSSRISGGIFRGRAHGNVPNHADFTNMMVGFETPVKGEVNIYVTDQYPRHVRFDLLKGESELVVIVKVVQSMAPILVMVARKFPIIQSERLFYFLNCFLNFNLDEGYNLYLYRSTKWIALGRFDQAMQDDDECEWEILDGNVHELHLLIVSLNSTTSTFWGLI
jgi:hypothetical protein